jgi:hypothetical protein
MSQFRVTVAALLLALVVGTGAEAVMTPSGIDPRLRLDWDAGKSMRGRPEVSGYVYNDYGRAAFNVRLIVETLDGSGQVVDRAYGYVVGIVPALNRASFDVPLRTEGASYRIAITSFEWRDGGA